MILNYFLELKNRTLLLLVTFLSTFCISYYYKEILLFSFFEPEILTDYFIFINVSEVFLVYLDLCTFFSFHFTLLNLAYQSFCFLIYGLFKSEYSYIRLVLKSVIILWCVSIAFSKLFIIPLMFKFFLSFNASSLFDFHFEARLSQYFYFCRSLYNSSVFYSQILAFGIFTFSYLNGQVLILTKYRKVGHYLSLLFATLLTPPDLISQLLLGTLFFIFYEVFYSILLLRISNKNLIWQPIKTN